MADEEETKKLPTEEKVQHKVWKVRVQGYEEAVKKFRLAKNDKDPEFNNYLGIIKKFVIDSNAVAQEKGLEAVLAFAENAACATKCCDEVISGIVLKVLNARPKTKQLGIDICMMYIELEKQESVMEELIKGFTNKQPKVVAASVQTVTKALSEFGGKVIKMKNLVQSIPKLLEHSDKTVREETKVLAIEIYKWIRDAIKPQLQNIKPVQLKELEDEWAKLEPVPPQPTRFTKTEQAKMEENPPPVAVAVASGDAGGAPVAVPAAVDPWEFMDPVEILSKLPKDFYEQVESKKWQERKEALEALDKLTSNPKLENGQYGEVCGVLKKVITKDSNINVVVVAGKCVTGLANGLRKKFQTYAALLIPAIFGKFKEKKLNVVLSLRDAIDACFATTNFTSIMEELLASLGNKNPSIKEETVKFLTRVISAMPPNGLSKGLLKQIVPAVIAKLDDTVGTVRDAAAECLGTIMKLVGEKALLPYIEPLDKIKQEKVKEFCEKAELSGAPASGAAAAAAPAAPAAAPPKAAPPKETKKDPPAAKPPPKKSAAKKPGGGGGAKKPAAKKAEKKKKGNDFGSDEVEPTESELPDGVVDEKGERIYGTERLNMMGSNNWKERLEAVNEMAQIEIPSDVPAQVIVRILAKKPGWKDSNFQVLNAKFKMLADLATKGSISRRSCMYAITGLISKIGDIKLKTQVKETLKVFATSLSSLNYISLKVKNAAVEAKNPKLQTEALVWMNESVREFGFRIDLKPHVEFIKTQLAHVNPGVRKAAIEFLATLYIYVGAKIRICFEEEKPALLQQIDAEFAKVQDEKPPIPTRKFKDDEEEEETAADEETSADAEDDAGPSINLEDMVDRVDIGSQITDDLIQKIMDKNWKIRKEGLEEVQTIISTAKFITPEIGELPTPLKARLGDNNKVLVTMAINISKQLAESGGHGMIKHKSILLPAIIGTLSDAKPNMRKLGEEALDSWHSKIGFVPFIDGEILANALKESNPNLKASLLTWLEKILPNEKKLPSELKESIAPLYACLEDRNPDVRKGANACVPLFMAHVGYESMSRAASKLYPTSQTTVQAMLEKVRETVVQKSSKSNSKQAESKAAHAASAAAASQAAAALSSVDGPGESKSKEPKKSKEKKDEKPAKGGSKKPPPAPSSKNKKQEVDEGPALVHKPGSKADRAKDEKKLKVLKWNFTTPRGELVDQLKEQLLPSVSAGLHAKLFHADFKFHLEAISILTKAISDQQDAVVESLDIILKWITLRFFDTNTSVLLKVLEYLAELFKMLESIDYKLTPLEHFSFMPYLISKVGDPKDNVRKQIKDLLKIITSVCPASKMFTYLMDGLPSKNSKTRMECCDELGFLISKFGMEVCQPSPKILKEVAAQIADRDNGVRSAALNCIVAAYNIVGESVYKLIGRLSDKDMGYLEERIKRTGKKEQPMETGKPKIVKPSDKVKAKLPEVATQDDQDMGMMHSTGTYKVQKRAQQLVQSPIKRVFELDLDSIEGGEGRISASVPQLQTIDMNAVNEAASIPEHLLNRYVHQFQTKRNGSDSYLDKSGMKDTGAILDLTISRISGADMQTAMESLVQIEEVFKRKKTEEEIIKRIDQYIDASLVQFKMLFTRHIDNRENSKEDIERLLKLLLSGMLTLFDEKCYSTVVSRSVLKDVIYFFITVLSDKIFEKFEESDVPTQCVNKLLLRVIKNSDKTNCFGGCIKLLQDLSENINTPESVMRLLMKCVWKLTHLLPDFINDINLRVLVVDIHMFFKVLPPSFWQMRSQRLPQQTMKALLQTLCKLRGNELVDCLSAIDDPSSSELTQYVLIHNPNKGKLSSNSNQRNLPAERKSDPTHVEPSDDVLIEIFKKIGSKENSRAGMNDLYHFKKRYPNYDIDPFIKSATPFFQNFIERSLKMIDEDEMAKSKQQEYDSNSSQPRKEENKISSDSAAYLERLNALRAKAKASRAAEKNAVSESPIPDVLPEPQVQKDTIKIPNVKLDEEPKEKAFDLGDIKNRLEQIKNRSK